MADRATVRDVLPQGGRQVYSLPMTALAAEVQPAPARPARRPRRVLVAAVLAAGAWRGRHPAAFLVAGIVVTGVSAPGVPAYVGVVESPAGAEVEPLDVTPRVLVISGDAEVLVHVCRDGGVGVVYADSLAQSCPVIAAPSGPLGRNAQVVLEVVGEGGVVVVDGVEDTYREGVRRGTQATGFQVAVTIGGGGHRRSRSPHGIGRAARPPPGPARDALGPVAQGP